MEAKICTSGLKEHLVNPIDTSFFLLQAVKKGQQYATGRSNKDDIQKEWNSVICHTVKQSVKLCSKITFEILSPCIYTNFIIKVYSYSCTVFVMLISVNALFITFTIFIHLFHTLYLDLKTSLPPSLCVRVCPPALKEWHHVSVFLPWPPGPSSQLFLFTVFKFSLMIFTQFLTLASRSRPHTRLHVSATTRAAHHAAFHSSSHTYRNDTPPSMQINIR